MKSNWLIWNVFWKSLNDNIVNVTTQESEARSQNERTVYRFEVFFIPITEF